MRFCVSLAVCLPFLIPSLEAQITPAVLQKMVAGSAPTNESFSFAAIGDQQYGPEGEQKWPALAESLNASASHLKFLIHVGDIKNGSSKCSNEMFANRLEAFNAIRMPFILTPGDNEWTDCHREADGSYDSLERLAYLRNIFFKSESSLGHPQIALFRQSQDLKYSLYRENALWTQGNVVFATVHIIGSNNNLGRNADNDREFAGRNQANLDWIRAAFHVATQRQFGAVVLAFQADPRFPLTADDKVKTTSGFVDLLKVLEEESIRFGKPVLALHGDSHFFRFDKPLISQTDKRELENFFRLEVPGEQDVHWVEVKVDPREADSPFVVTYKSVRANYLKHPLP